MIPTHIINGNHPSDMIYNIIIASFISSISAAIISQLSTLIKIILAIFHYYFNYFSKLLNTNNGEVIIYGTKIINADETNIYFPPSCKAVLYRMKEKNINLFSITENSDTSQQKFNDNFQKFNFFVNDNIRIFQIEDDLKVKFKVSSSMHGKDDISTHYKLSIILFSKKLSVSEIQNKISEYLKKYTEIIEKYNYDGNLYCYDLQLSKSKKIQGSTDTILRWTKNLLKSSKTFKNIFFEDKDEILKKLNFFLEKEDWYINKGIPYTLGFLFHGNPGCGKTSCIKALANYTQRHILQINLKNIKTCGEFVSIFNDINIGNIYLPYENRIIVLEDIDCMIDLVKSRNKNNNDNNNNNNSNDDYDNDDNDDNGDNGDNIDNDNKKKNIDIVKLLLSNKKNKFNSEDELTLACILNTIDGIVEHHGRILIITTNYIEQLDDALIRPGRIDMKVNFTKCSDKMCRNILEHFYDTKLDDNFIFENYKYSPAELLEICFKNHDDIDKCLKII
jgi:hypothetical protein